MAADLLEASDSLIFVEPSGECAPTILTPLVIFFSAKKDKKSPCLEINALFGVIT